MTFAKVIQSVDDGYAEVFDASDQEFVRDEKSVWTVNCSFGNKIDK